MNYFELYNLPVSFLPDQGEVKKAFYRLSREYHPDFYGQADEEEQAVVLEKASEINRAYKVLTSPDETTRYVLTLKGLLEEEEKYQLSPEFLMDMMDLNEQAMEIADETDAAKLKESIFQHQKEIYEPVETIMANYQEGISTEKELLQVKEYYFRKKYLNRILAGLT